MAHYQNDDQIRRPIAKSLIAACLILCCLFVLARAGDIVTVITEKGYIRSSPRFYAPILAEVKFEDSLETLAEEGDWLNVGFGQVEGYIHKNEIEKRDVNIRPVLLGADPVPETEDTAVLAGKGFNAVEAGIRNSHNESSFGYETVDRITDYMVPPEELHAFIVYGGLNLPK